MCPGRRGQAVRTGLSNSQGHRIPRPHKPQPPVTHSVTLHGDQAAWGGPFLQGLMQVTQAATLNIPARGCGGRPSTPGPPQPQGQVAFSAARWGWPHICPFVLESGAPVTPNQDRQEQGPGQSTGRAGLDSGWGGLGRSGSRSTEGTARLLLITDTQGQAPASTALKAPTAAEAPNCC